MKKKLVFVTCILGANLNSFAVSQEAVSTVSIVESNSAPAAPQAPNMINLLHQRGWVRLDDDGSVQGKLSVLTAEGQLEGRIGAKILISRDGKVVLSTVTDTDGVFKLDGLKPGTYGLQSRGDYTFAAFALHVLPASATHLSSDLDVYAAVIPAARASELILAGLVPAELSSGEDAYYRNFESDPLKGKRTFNNSHQVVLQDGVLVGRVSRPGWTFEEQDLSGSVAQIVREGEVIANAAVGKDGYYRIENMEPGVYDLFVSGDDGFAVSTFEAINASEPIAVVTQGGARLITTQSGTAADTLGSEMISQNEVFLDDPIIVQGSTEDEFGMPVTGGGFAGPGGFGGGGAGGGGGGGLGGGGIGGLLGIAGLAVGIAALSDDDADVGTPIAP